MSQNKIDRRSFFGSVFCMGGLAVLSTPQRALERNLHTSDDAVCKLPLVRTIQRPDSAAVVGQAYLCDAPEAADIGKLNETILESLNVSVDGAAAMDPVELHRRVRARVRADFHEGKTAKVNGWILSLTEARVSALVALS